MRRMPSNEWNPYLRDPIDRVTRDPIRKLGWDDRVVGSIRFAMNAGINPEKMISSARKGLNEIISIESLQTQSDALNLAWHEIPPSQELETVHDLVLNTD